MRTLTFPTGYPCFLRSQIPPHIVYTYPGHNEEALARKRELFIEHVNKPRERLHTSTFLCSNEIGDIVSNGLYKEMKNLKRDISVVWIQMV